MLTQSSVCSGILRVVLTLFYSSLVNMNKIYTPAPSPPICPFLIKVTVSEKKKTHTDISELPANNGPVGPHGLPERPAGAPASHQLLTVLSMSFHFNLNLRVFKILKGSHKAYLHLGVSRLRYNVSPKTNSPKTRQPQTSSPTLSL